MRILGGQRVSKTNLLATAAKKIKVAAARSAKYEPITDFRSYRLS